MIRSARSFFQQYKKKIDTASIRGLFLMLVDVSKLDVLTLKGRDLAARSMQYARAHRLLKIIEIATRPITTLSIQEAADRVEGDEFRIVVESLEEAGKTIEELKQKLPEMSASE